jgi:peptide/nickel transport system permease protein
VPVFIIGAFIMFFIIRYYSSPSHLLPVFWSVCFFSMPLAWLLAQTGYGLPTNQAENSRGWKLIRDTGIKLFVRLLKLTGFIIVINIFEGEFTNQRGLGRLFISNMSDQDYPAALGIIWVFVIIVVLATLAAELLEIAHNYYKGRTVLIEPVMEKPRKPGIPKGWLIVSLALLFLTVLVAVIGPLLAPYEMNRIDLLHRLASPSPKFLLGTDQLGRDILSQLLYGFRIDLFAGLACAAIVSLLAGGWATLAACCKNMNNLWGDTLEDIVMLPRKIICSFPWLVLLFLLEPFLAGRSVLLVAFLAGLVVLPRTTGMIQEAYGAPPERLNWLLMILKSIPVVFIFTAAAVIIYIATISYLGFGVNPGISEFGAMISGGGLQYIQTAPRLLIWPSMCLTGILIVWVMTGEAVRERLGFRSGALWSKTME